MLIGLRLNIRATNRRLSIRVKEEEEQKKHNYYWHKTTMLKEHYYLQNSGHWNDL